ncbi:MAG TPA: hypothetical protein V6D30_03935 [Leptolyngbyaceae cyanobacterium]
MLKILPYRQPCLDRLRLTYALTPLTLGVALLTVTGMPAEARPVVIQSSPPTSFIYGSPIPSPVPVNPVTGQPSSLSSYGYRDYNHNLIRRPLGNTIRNSTLINPTVIDSTISDSVLIDPVIINSPRSTRSPLRRYSPRSTRSPLRRSGVIYNSPGSLRVRIGL